MRDPVATPSTESWPDTRAGRLDGNRTHANAGKILRANSGSQSKKYRHNSNHQIHQYGPLAVGRILAVESGNSYGRIAGGRTRRAEVSTEIFGVCHPPIHHLISGAICQAMQDAAPAARESRVDRSK